jgi:TetR/AcrR family transcriptional regulator, mexJK operon transcriptional repressor
MMRARRPAARKAAAPRKRRVAEKAVSAAVAPARGGRPSRAQAQKLPGRILDAATHLFLSLGYGATSIEAVARRARISKRTFYHRFADKPALFDAVVHRIIERLRPPPGAPIIAGANLGAILEHLAGLILKAALSEPAIALHRLVVAESARFPKLATIATEQEASKEAIRLIAGLLDREASVHVDDSMFAAQQFLHMVIALPQRRALGMGTPMGPAELRAWPRAVAELFLYGCRGK